MTRQHGIIYIATMAFLSAVFYLAYSEDLTYFEHNDRAETIIDGAIANAAIPIARSDQGHIFLPVSINDAPDLLFFLDTGAPDTLIFGHEGTEAIPLSLGEDVVIRGNGTGAPAKGRLIESMDVAIGPIRINGLKGRWVHRRNMAFPLPESDVPVGGIIGYDLFSRFVVEINMADNVLRLYDSLGQVPQVSDTPIPFRIKHRKPYGDVEVIIDDSRPVRVISDAMIDTGSIDRLELTIPTDPATPFPSLPKNLIPSVGFGFQGRVEGQIGRVDHLRLGYHRFTDILIEFAKPHGGASEGEAQLGMGILTRFDLIFDYQGRQLFMIERPDSYAAFDLGMSGMTLEQRGERLVVSQVIPGTAAAEKNFRPGDTITKIEGMPASNVQKARSLLRSGDGKKISVCRHTRKGEKCKTLRVQGQI